MVNGVSCLVFGVCCLLPAVSVRSCVMCGFRNEESGLASFEFGLTIHKLAEKLAIGPLPSAHWPLVSMIGVWALAIRSIAILV